MESWLHLTGSNRFPCPLCGSGLDVRASKKKKPYVICDPCGVQMFVRNGAGISKLEKLVAAANKRKNQEQREDLQNRYRKKCPQCDKLFWISEKLIVTSWLDGSFTGYRCPREKLRWDRKV